MKELAVVGVYLKTNYRTAKPSVKFLTGVSARNHATTVIEHVCMMMTIDNSPRIYAA